MDDVLYDTRMLLMYSWSRACRQDPWHLSRTLLAPPPKSLLHRHRSKEYAVVQINALVCEPSKFLHRDDDNEDALVWVVDGTLTYKFVQASDDYSPNESIEQSRE
jgi:hypothetical protein